MGYLVWGASVAVGETVILNEDDGEKLSKTSKAKATQTLTTHGCVPRHCLQSHSIQKPCKTGIAKIPILQTTRTWQSQDWNPGRRPSALSF